MIIIKNIYHHHHIYFLYKTILIDIPDTCQSKTNKIYKKIKTFKCNIILLNTNIKIQIILGRGKENKEERKEKEN
jgi:hypothetical protein